MADALIHALHVNQGDGTRHLALEDLVDWNPGEGIVWAHFDADHDETFPWLTEHMDMPKLVPEALVALETRPRTSMIGPGLLIVLRGVNLNPGADPEDMVSIRLWVEEHRIISTRRRKLLSVGDTIESLEQRPASGTADILLRLADRLVERINDSIDTLEEQAAELEDAVLTEPVASLRGSLSNLRREAIVLRRYLAPQREALGRLQTESPAWFTAEDRMRLRETYDRLVRLVEDLDSVRERLTVVHEELVSRLSDQLNQRMYVLSIVAALFLPLGFLTGLLGINVGGIPGADNPLAFWIFAGLLGVLVTAQVLIFKKFKWF